MYDTSHESIIGDSPIPTFLAVNAKTVGDIDEPLPQLPPVVNGDDMAFMFHTSGSTSGMPKLVPWSYTWLDNAIDKGVQVQRHDILETGIQIVGSWLGSVCHSGQNLGSSMI
jgi:acyl-CoA synthetase (AMP-forming)/AMP-acid ligase II